ncbi:peptidoglycan-binding domain-containing protein [Streptomyces sp. NPDC000994]
MVQSFGLVSAIAATAVVVPAGTASAAPHCAKGLVTYNIYMPVASDNSLNCTMGRGSYSNAVLALQFNLNLCYGAGLAEDKDFGPATEAALKAVQRKEKVAVDGVYGPNTRNAMLWVRGSVGCVKFFS